MEHNRGALGQGNTARLRSRLGFQSGRLSCGSLSGRIVGAGLGQPAVTQFSPDGLMTIFGQNLAPAGTSRPLSRRRRTRATARKPGLHVRDGELSAVARGLTHPSFAAGTVADQIAPAVFPVTVILNGAPLAASGVLYAGAAPGYIGLYQIKIRIPTGTPAGNVPIALSIDGASRLPGAFLTVGH